jgi:hypothetical protein
MNEKTEKHRKMIITDLDGTLLRDDRRYNAEDIATLEELGKQRVVRAIATGRNLYSAQKVIPFDFPIDYLIFSSGAGIMEWSRKHIEQAYHLDIEEIESVRAYLSDRSFDFIIQKPIPDNHLFLYFKNNHKNPDFERRLHYYEGFGEAGDRNRIDLDAACQFLVIEPRENGYERFAALLAELDHVKIVRTTSPLDHESLWIEIFPRHVSKAKGSEYVAERCDVDPDHIYALGNDFNDLDLLHWAPHKYVVENARDELKELFPVVSANNEAGFSKAVFFWLG